MMRLESASTAQIESLLELTCESIVRHINTYKPPDFRPIPDDLACILFRMVLQRGKLNPKVLKLFEDTGNPMLLQQIQALNLKDTPVLLIDSRNSWLGEKPRLF